MENKQRDVGPDVKGKKETKKRRSKEKERLTIMIFRKIGKVRTVKISSYLIVWASLFFLFYIVATILLTNRFLDIYRENKMLADENAQLRTENIKKNKELRRKEQHIALLNDHIEKEKDESPELVSKGGYTEPSLPEIVDIEELDVKRDGSTINVAFRIVNKQVHQESIGGYIFVLVKIRDSDQSEVWVYPSSSLKDGLPADYRKGERFLIQRFRTISGKYTLGNSTDKPLILEILVYDRDGELILRKVVEV